MEHLRNFLAAPRLFVSLKAIARNLWTHSPKQIQPMDDSIRKLGFVNPILTDPVCRVIAGDGRIEAAKLLGINKLPTISLADMTEAQKRAYILTTDDKLVENAALDNELLSLELGYITELDIDFDLTIAGFETAETCLPIDAPNTTGGAKQPMRSATSIARSRP